MGDAGEGLIDAESRIQERMEELARERNERLTAHLVEPEAARALESLRLARAELVRQIETTVHERRRAALADALVELDRRMVEAAARVK